jgi:hypothetical protein
MKKTFFTNCTGAFLACTVTSLIYAQNADINVKPQPHFSTEKNISSSEQMDTAKDSDSLFLNDINIKAVQHFMTTYKNPSDVRWSQLKNGFRVHFISDDIQTRIFYNAKGSPESMIRYYHEDKLPLEIRHLVKSNYYDFSIFVVTEININRKIAYLVKMVDKTSWKTIKVVDGEMEVIEEYSKSK